DELLAEVADDVVKHVLSDNYLQAQILSQEAAVSAQRIGDYEELMELLEAQGLLERSIEQLPPTDEMAERDRVGAEMPRPELAALLAYAKISLKTALLASRLPGDPYLEHDLAAYFPARVVERFGHLLAEHPLRRELIATVLANDVVDSQGITFVSRAVAETGAEPADVARAFRIARAVTGADDRWTEIEELDGVIDPVLQNELLAGVDWLVEKTSRWYLQNAPGVDLGATIAADAPGFAELNAHLGEVVSASSRAAREEAAAQLIARGSPETLARRHVFQPALVHAPDIVAVARVGGLPIADVARAFSSIGDVLHLDWLEGQLDRLAAGSRWERWALNAVEDDLLVVRREAVARALASADGGGVGDAAVAEGEARAASVDAAAKVADGDGRRDDAHRDRPPNRRAPEVDRVARSGRAEAEKRHPSLPVRLPDLDVRAGAAEARSVGQPGKAEQLEATHALADRDRPRQPRTELAQRPLVSARDREELLRLASNARAGDGREHEREQD